MRTEVRWEGGSQWGQQGNTCQAWEEMFIRTARSIMPARVADTSVVALERSRSWWKSGPWQLGQELLISCLFTAMTRGKTAELVRIEESEIIDERQEVGKTEEMDG